MPTPRHSHPRRGPVRAATQTRLDPAQMRYLEIRAELEESNFSTLIRQCVDAQMARDIQGGHLPESDVRDLLALVGDDSAAADARELAAENERRELHDDVPMRAEDLRR